MSDAVKRYWVDDPELHTLLRSDDGGTMHAFVLATAYDALEAENVRLRKALLEIEWFSKGLSRGDDAGQCGRYVLSLADAALAASNNKGNGT